MSRATRRATTQRKHAELRTAVSIQQRFFVLPSHQPPPRGSTVGGGPELRPPLSITHRCDGVSGSEAGRIQAKLIPETANRRAEELPLPAIRTRVLLEAVV